MRSEKLIVVCEWICEVSKARSCRESRSAVSWAFGLMKVVEEWSP